MRKSKIPVAAMKYALVLAAGGLAGCALIDQRTFAPSPEAEPVVLPVKPLQIDPRTPLVVIDYATPQPDFQALLRLAVRAAEARDGHVRYDVVAVTRDVRAAIPGQALDIMRAIMAENVPAARVNLGLRADPLIAATQVRVYVR